MSARAGEPALDEMIVGDARDVGVAEPRDEGLGLRALHRDEPGGVRDVAPPRLGGVLADPLPVLVDVGRVDGQHVAVGGEPIEREIVDDAAVGIAEQGILHLSDRERADVVGGQPLQRGQGLGPFDLELAHVAHVEAAHRRAHRPMLLDDAGVLHRHLPATEGHHTGAGFHVGVEERGALQGRIHERPSRPPALRTGQGLALSGATASRLLPPQA
jgi:hypothetical protein